MIIKSSLNRFHRLNHKSSLHRLVHVDGISVYDTNALLTKRQAYIVEFFFQKIKVIT